MTRKTGPFPRLEPLFVVGNSPSLPSASWPAGPTAERQARDGPLSLLSGTAIVERDLVVDHGLRSGQRRNAKCSVPRYDGAWRDLVPQSPASEGQEAQSALAVAHRPQRRESRRVTIPGSMRAELIVGCSAADRSRRTRAQQRRTCLGKRTAAANRLAALWADRALRPTFAHSHYDAPTACFSSDSIQWGRR